MKTYLIIGAVIFGMGTLSAIGDKFSEMRLRKDKPKTFRIVEKVVDFIENVMGIVILIVGAVVIIAFFGFMFFAALHRISAIWGIMF